MTAIVVSSCITSSEAAGNSDSVRKPCATVVPYGPFAASSSSTWIDPRSSIARAKASIRACGTSIHDDGPSSRPGVSSVTLTTRSRACLEDAADDPFELLRDGGRQLPALRPQNPAHADQLAEA